MPLQARPAEFRDVEDLRKLYRQESRCQIIHDSALPRGLADPYVILVNGKIGGYGAVWNEYYENRLMEFYTLPHLRNLALPMFRELLATSRATRIEAQTNIPLMLLVFHDCATGIEPEKILFHDAFTTHLECPKGVFRHAEPQDQGPDGEWVIEAAGAIVAAGGFLCHYNPPYGDIYMEVAEAFRRQSFGGYLVQELKRVCYEGGKKPAARCDPDNVASRKTLEKAGLLPCGHLLVGEVP